MPEPLSVPCCACLGQSARPKSSHAPADPELLKSSSGPLPAQRVQVRLQVACQEEASQGGWENDGHMS